MKANSHILTIFPGARYVVEGGKVKMIRFDGTTLDISSQRNRYILWSLVQRYGLGNQYV